MIILCFHTEEGEPMDPSMIPEEQLYNENNEEGGNGVDPEVGKMKLSELLNI